MMMDLLGGVVREKELEGILLTVVAELITGLPLTNTNFCCLFKLFKIGLVWVSGQKIN